MNKRGLGRRTLKQITQVPQVKDFIDEILDAEGWPYKSDKDNYRLRDKALISITYILALRISEALRLTREQFQIEKDKITVRGIKLSKSRVKDKPRKEQYRELGFISLEGERKQLGILIKKYLEGLGSNEELFKFKRIRAYQIVSANLGIPIHWLRAFGEDFLYTLWKYDIMAVSDYTKQDVRTLSQYLRKRYMKYPIS